MVGLSPVPAVVTQIRPCQSSMTPAMSLASPGIASARSYVVTCSNTGLASVPRTASVDDLVHLRLAMASRSSAVRVGVAALQRPHELLPAAST